MVSVGGNDGDDCSPNCDVGLDSDSMQLTDDSVVIRDDVDHGEKLHTIPIQVTAALLP